jgi:hypothetical protein
VAPPKPCRFLSEMTRRRLLPTEAAPKNHVIATELKVNAARDNRR